MKLRSFHFRRRMNIGNFVTDLRNIHELCNVKDEKAVDLVAISHVTTSLDEELREPIRILQLSATATWGGILEPIQSKQTQHSFSPKIPVASSINVDSNNHLDRLEKLVKGLTDTVQKLTTSSNAAFAQPMSSTASICDHCGKSGHNKQSCFKLKTCLKCGLRGHIVATKMAHVRHNHNSSHREEEVALYPGSKRILVLAKPQIALSVILRML